MKVGNLTLAVTAVCVVLLMPAVAYAQQWPIGTWWDPEAVVAFLFPGMPREWISSTSGMFYYVFLPFVCAYAVIYGILTELRIFRRTSRLVNVIIAGCMCFSLLPSGILTYIVTLFYAAGAFFGLIAFGVLFFIGTFLWARHRGYEWYYEEFSVKKWDKERQKAYEKAQEEAAKVRKKTASEIDKTLAKYGRERNKLKKELENVENKLENKIKLIGKVVEKIHIAELAGRKEDVTVIEQSERIPLQREIDVLQARRDELSSKIKHLDKLMKELRLRRAGI